MRYSFFGVCHGFEWQGRNEVYVFITGPIFVSCRHDETKICDGEKVHSMRVWFVRPRNFPAMSTFFPPCQDLLCEAAGFCACCERTNNFCL